MKVCQKIFAYLKISFLKNCLDQVFNVCAHCAKVVAGNVQDLIPWVPEPQKNHTHAAAPEFLYFYISTSGPC